MEGGKVLPLSVAAGMFPEMGKSGEDTHSMCTALFSQLAPTQGRKAGQGELSSLLLELQASWPWAFQGLSCTVGFPGSEVLDLD